MERDNAPQGDEPEAETGLNGSEVAVIGLAGRFPGAADVEAFWENLKNGVESVRFFSEEELLAAGVSAGMIRRPEYVRAWPVLDGVDLFDAALFNIPPREAQLMDPQHRLFLECAWEALERAGYNSDSHDGLVGVYAGLDLNTYLFNLTSNPAVMEAAGSFQAEIASDKDYLATRVSYKLDLRGPSLTVQAACATSLVAVHLACQGLLSGECDMALAGGASLKVPPNTGYLSLEGGIQSPDGHCRAFDARAQGTIFGSGLGIVVLKRLTDALADGDVIHAVIKGSAINNDGALKIGYSAPGGEGQFQVIRAAQMLAEVDPATITYVEAHGTGTPLGDPIEVAALTRAFRTSTDARGFCGIGSVKTNVGHLKSAAGVTGLIKAVLALEHKLIPPSLHLETPNPHIDFAGSPFYVVDRLTEWEPAPGAPRRAAVSSFGVGGTNAHAILEEAPPRPASGLSRPWQLLVVSGNTPTALAAQRDRLAEHLFQHPDAVLADVAFTLRAGRRRLPHRGWATCRGEDLDDAIAALTDPERFQTVEQEARDRPVIFLFPGQGTQHPNMGRTLYETEPVFLAGVDRCCEILRPHLGLDLRDLLYPAPSGEAAAAERLEQTALAQPALFVVEHALAGLWMSWGIRPQAMIGHSIGEYVAAALAGVFRLEDALALVAERGRLMQGLPAGAMLSVSITEADLLPRLPAGVSLAAVNGPARLVVSGPEDAVAGLEAELDTEGVAVRRLHTSHAFHSAMMDPILEPFNARVSAVRREAPKIPFVSNHTGTWIRAEEATDPAYWASHLRGAVRFADGLATLASEEEAVLLEVGPGQTLSSFARQLPGRPAGQAVARSLPHPKETKSDAEMLLGTLGQLWAAGVTPDWKAFHGDEERLRVELPTYPFERQRYWVERQTFAAVMVAETSRELARQELSDWFAVQSWKPSVPPEAAPPAASRWLLFADRRGLADAIARRLEAAGEAVVTVDPDELDPYAVTSWTDLLARLRQDGPLPDRVLHLAGVTGPDGASAEADLALADRGFHSLLALAQALGRQSLGTPGQVQVRAVVDGLQSVRGERVVWPGKATVLGPVRTLPLEHPEIGAAAVDVVLPEDPADTAALDRLADLLIAEASAPATEPVVAYRGEERWVEGFEPVRIDPGNGRFALPERAVCLITGGLGGLGLALAEELARSRQARLVLTGRTGLPEREQWTAWVAFHGEADPSSRKIRQIESLEALGAEVMAVAADVTDEAALAAAVRSARERFGPIQAVIHAAGVPGGGVLQLKTHDAADRVLAPKVRGTRALATALAGEPLELFALCSSTYALTGGVGQVDYCAANSFLDAFARAESGIARRVVSLGWGPWSEVGMAVQAGSAAAPRPVHASGAASRPAPTAEPTGASLHPLLDRRLPDSEGSDRIAFATDLSTARHWVLAEHRILGTPTMPGTAYLEMARAAFATATGARRVEIRDVAFVSPLLVPEGDTREMRTELAPAAEGAMGFRITSRTGADSLWQEHARGRLAAIPEETSDRASDLAALELRCGLRQVSAESREQPGADGFIRAGSLVVWGPRWQSFRQADVGLDEALVSLELPAAYAGDVGDLGLHPALLDVATAYGAGFAGEGNLLPHSYGVVRTLAPLPAALYAHIRRSPNAPAGDGFLTLDVTLMDHDGRVSAEIERFTLRRVAEDGARPRPAASSTSTGTADKTSPDRAAWISPTEGTEAFRRAVSRGRFAHVAVSPVSLSAALALLRRPAEEGPSAAMAAAPSARFPRPQLDTAFALPGNDVERTLVEVWQGVLGIDRIGVHDNFFDLGGDSVVGIQIVAQSAGRGVQISPEQLFEHQTIAALARTLGASTPAEPDGAAPAEAPETPEETASGSVTPADFPEAGLSQESLDRLFSRVRDLAS
jgi:acyl transferase domain-containing protein